MRTRGVGIRANGVEDASDAELLVAAASDLTAFEGFYRRYVRRVAAFAARRCSSAEDVADVVAQTFVRLLEVAERYDPARGEPGPFVLTIAANLARDLHRHDSRQRDLVWRLSGPDMLDGDDIERVEAALDAAAVARSFPQALDGVPPGEREMLRLVAEGRTPGQAADELGISPGAAWTRLSRARRRVRTRIRAIDEESP